MREQSIFLVNSCVQPCGGLLADVNSKKWWWCSWTGLLLADFFINQNFIFTKFFFHFQVPSLAIHPAPTGPQPQFTRSTPLAGTVCHLGYLGEETGGRWWCICIEFASSSCATSARSCNVLQKHWRSRTYFAVTPAQKRMTYIWLVWKPPLRTGRWQV